MSSQSQHNTIQRRKFARQKSFLRGIIYFNNRRSVFDCLIRDISPCGARLIFSDSVTTPDVLDLYIPQKEQTLRTHVTWRRGQEVGVSFAQVTETDHPAESGNLTGRVARLEVECAALKRALKKLKADADPETEVA
jgi:PilZ domain